MSSTPPVGDTATCQVFRKAEAQRWSNCAEAETYMSEVDQTHLSDTPPADATPDDQAPADSIANESTAGAAAPDDSVATQAAPSSGTFTYNGTTLELKLVPATEGAS